MALQIWMGSEYGAAAGRLERQGTVPGQVGENSMLCAVCGRKLAAFASAKSTQCLWMSRPIYRRCRWQPAAWMASEPRRLSVVCGSEQRTTFDGVRGSGKFSGTISTRISCSGCEASGSVS